MNESPYTKVNTVTHTLQPSPEPSKIFVSYANRCTKFFKNIPHKPNNKYTLYISQQNSTYDFLL